MTALPAALASAVNKTPTAASPPELSFDRILEFAVLSNWEELKLGAAPVQIEIEYMPADTAPLEYLKVWSSSERGHWDLVCEHWGVAHGDKSVGLNFLNKAHSSSSFASFLESIISHQSAFGMNSSAVGRGLVQVINPTDPERRAAEACTSRFVQLWKPVAA